MNTHLKSTDGWTKHHKPFELLYDTDGNLIGMETIEAYHQQITRWFYDDCPPNVFYDQSQSLLQSANAANQGQSDYDPVIVKSHPVKEVHWDSVILLTLVGACATVLLILGAFALVTQTIEFVRQVC